MTLIYSNFSPSAGLIAVSDVLTSAPRKGNPPQIALPLKRDPIAFASASDVLQGTAQKTVISNGTMVQWAGLLHLARTAIQTLRQATDDGKHFIEKEDLFSRLDFTPGQWDQLNLIYHFRSGPYLQRWEHRCQTANSDNAQLLVAGSEFWDYMENTEVHANIPSYGPMYFTAEAIGRAFRAFGSEIRNSSNYAFHYGGWLDQS